LSGPHYVYLILHFPTTDPRGGARKQEIDFIVGKKFLVTARYEVVEPVHSLHRVFEAEELLGLPVKSKSADVMVERILRYLYGAIREQVEQTALQLDRIEDSIFAGQERQMVRAISLVGRSLLRFDMALTKHAEPLKAFLHQLEAPAFFGKDFGVHSAHIQAEHDHTEALVTSYRNVALELRRTNESLLTSSQNETMRTLTIMAFVLYPLTLIVGLFGMNIEDMPLVGEPGSFWIIIGILIVAAIGLLGIFRLKKWL
ncbi:MAG TPA: CorA family divalent cation transporter, partial [Candidatus Paceibacterota bacterium]